MKLPLVVGALAAGLLVLAVVGRSGTPVAEDRRKPRAVAPREIPEAPLVEAVSVPPALEWKEPEYWGLLGYFLESNIDAAQHREKVLELTVRHLGLDAVKATEFRGCAAQSIAQLSRAWEIRETAVLGGTLQDLEIQSSYEEAKRMALEPLETFLLARPQDGPFLARIEEWIDVVR